TIADAAPQLGTEEIAQAQGTPGNDSENDPTNAFGGEVGNDLANDPQSEIEEYPAARPQLSALELYNRGKQALRNGDKDTALRYYTAAHQSGERLEHRKVQEIQEFLAQNRAKGKKIELLTRQVPESELEPAAPDDFPRPIDTVDEQRAVTLDKLRNQVLNAKIQAEKLAASDPQKALELIDRTQAGVERSGLEGAVTMPLLKSLAKSREQVESTRKLNEPRLDM